MINLRQFHSIHFVYPILIQLANTACRIEQAVFDKQFFIFATKKTSLLNLERFV